MYSQNEVVYKWIEEDLFAIEGWLHFPSVQASKGVLPPHVQFNFPFTLKVLTVHMRTILLGAGGVWVGFYIHQV